MQGKPECNNLERQLDCEGCGDQVVHAVKRLLPDAADDLRLDRENGGVEENHGEDDPFERSVLDDIVEEDAELCVLGENVEGGVPERVRLIRLGEHDLEQRRPRTLVEVLRRLDGVLQDQPFLGLLLGRVRRVVGFALFLLLDGLVALARESGKAAVRQRLLVLAVSETRKFVPREIRSNVARGHFDGQVLHESLCSPDSNAAHRVTFRLCLKSNFFASC